MSNTLVAYFSATGVTAKVANAIAKAKKADICEIKPELAYTKEDLDWTNMQSRSSIEMQNKDKRPAMQETNIDISQYQTIYLGFPIWWYVAPTIVNTFLEAYDFSGKKIVLFATAGSSDWGKTVEELVPSVDATTQIIATQVLKRGHTDEDISDFINTHIRQANL